MTTITLSVPGRERDGFGCPHCGAPLPTEGLLRAALFVGLPCCGYRPESREVYRWALAGRALAEVA